MNHRDHQAAIQAKRMREELDDEEAARIAELLAADQQRQIEQPKYMEVANAVQAWIKEQTK